MEVVLWVIGIFLTWLITHCYYKKSLRDQDAVSQEEIEELKKMISKESWQTKEGLRLKHIELGMEEYKHAGTPKKVIDTFDISQEEKAEIYDTVLLRVKGRVGKSNPYR